MRNQEGWRWLRGGGLMGLCLLVAACSTPRETAVVIARPDATSAPTPDPPDPAAQTTPRTQPAPPNAQPLDAASFGRMWTFDAPPTTHFQETYGFTPDSAWYALAQRAALKFGGNCSGAFVSRDGLVMTNHHCAREHLEALSTPDEDLLEAGYFATTTAEERKVTDLHVDQLLGIESITEQVYAGVRAGMPAPRELDLRKRNAEAIEARMTQEVKQRDTTLFVTVVPFSGGASYAAYTYRRYHDVRLVFAPEHEVAFFGGASDNFTYPRYTLDLALFRVYDETGSPFTSLAYFPWTDDTLTEGTPVFTVGNPGSTRRILTGQQLAFLRDYTLPQQVAYLESREAFLSGYVAAYPDSAAAYDLRNTLFSLQNSLKAARGEWQGLQDSTLIARKEAADAALAQAIAADPTLLEKYGDVFDQLSGLNRTKRSVGGTAGAFAYFVSPRVSSHILSRAAYAYYYDFLRSRDVDEEVLKTYYEPALAIEDWPAAVEAAFLQARFEDLQRYLGPNDITVKSLLAGKTPAARAQEIVAATALLDSVRFRAVLDAGYLSSGDVSVKIAEALVPLYFSRGQEVSTYEEQEAVLNARRARAYAAVYGTVPPDATFTLRLSDGVVRSIETASGASIAPFTTFFGMYDHAFGADPGATEWRLPERWLTPPAVFDLDTPLNLITTNDITGGSSGSPLLNQELEIVGLVFDGNLASLPNTFLFQEAEARTIAVDARAIIEVLDDLYEADRLAQELLTGRVIATEAEADARAGD